MIEITNNIYYVGVNDRNKELFEGLWPLPNGDRKSTRLNSSH